jgi:RNA polymerase sigma-70 factor, ECF subfamily
MMTVATETRTDEQLARTALGRGDGDREALGELLERHSGPLFGFFALQVGDATLAEDLVQEVFMRVIGAGGRFDPRRQFRPWLWTIAPNLAKSARSRRGHAQAHQSLDDLGPGGEVPLSERLADPAPSPRARREQSERSERLRDALDRMEGPHREVLLLKYFQDLPSREVAEILGISEGTVWSRTHRALHQMGQLLGPEFEEDDRS